MKLPFENGSQLKLKLKLTLPQLALPHEKLLNVFFVIFADNAFDMLCLLETNASAKKKCEKKHFETEINIHVQPNIIIMNKA